MNQQDFKLFTDAWAIAQEIMPGGKQLSPPAMRIVIDALIRYPIDAVLFAIKRHIAIGKFAPIPRDIIDILETGTRHVGADEAWAIALESMDERVTVAMTKEIAEARGIALPILESGDEIGARMAFRDAYNRIIVTSPSKPMWYLSEGHDSDGRKAAAEKSVQLGRLTREQADKYLPAPKDGGPIGKLLTGKIDELPTNNAVLRERWAELKQALLDGQQRLEDNERREREEKQLEFEQRKDAALLAVEKKLAEKALA